MISCFDANILVYSTAPASEPKGLQARQLIARGMRSGTSVLLLQSLSEFSNVILRKTGMPVDPVRRYVDAWRAVLPIHPASETDLADALEAVKKHHLQFWDAMMWASAHRIGVRYLISEDLQDGRVLAGVTFINPFTPANDALIDHILPP